MGMFNNPDIIFQYGERNNPVGTVNTEECSCAVVPCQLPPALHKFHRHLNKSKDFTASDSPTPTCHNTLTDITARPFYCLFWAHPLFPPLDVENEGGWGCFLCCSPLWLNWYSPALTLHHLRFDSHRDHPYYKWIQTNGWTQPLVVCLFRALEQKLSKGQKRGYWDGPGRDGGGWENRLGDEIRQEEQQRHDKSKLLTDLDVSEENDHMSKVLCSPVGSLWPYASRQET